MGGVIKPEIRHAVCDCGERFVNKELPDFINPIPYCEKCRKTPNVLRIRITLPGSPKKDIRYSMEGSRLNRASLADATLVRIREEVKSGVFDHLKYTSKQGKESLLFKNFCMYHLQTRENISSEGRRSILSLNNNYLIPFFGDMYIFDITSGLIKQFELEWQAVGNAKTTRQRDKCIDLLYGILKLAKELELIKDIPSIPKTEKSKRKTDSIDFETQELILSKVSSHLAAFKLMRLYMMRPCEIRSLKWGDINRKDGVLHIRSHFSNKVEMQGRKSIKNPDNDFFDHQVPLYAEFYEIMKDVPISLNKDEYIFKTKTGKPLYESALRKIWNAAVKKAGVSHIDLYSGLKRSSGQLLTNAGALPDQVRILMGQTSLESTSHYIRSSAVPLKGVAEGLLDKVKAGNPEEKQVDNT